MNLIVRKTELITWPYCVESNIFGIDKELQSLLSRIDDWLKYNKIKYDTGVLETYSWYFRSESDAILFLLKWS